MSGAHIVAPGETLGGIAEQYGLRLADLVAWNNIADANLIQAGQKIELSGHLPADPGDPGGRPSQGADREYVVQPGDTVTSIALAHAVSWKGIQVANNLADVNVITAGQKLIIPDNPH